MAKDNFKNALKYVLKSEGGYVNHPNDPGGPTNRGITQKTLKKRRGRDVSIDEIKNLTEEDIELIYQDEYWQKVLGDELPKGLDYAVFDMAVNAGPGTSAKLLQRSLGIPVNGRIDPATLEALQKRNPEDSIKDFTDARRRYYDEIIKNKSALGAFRKGWDNRVNHSTKTALTMAGYGGSAVNEELPIPVPPPRPRDLGGAPEQRRAYSSPSAGDILFDPTPMGPKQTFRPWNQPTGYPNTDKLERPVQDFDPLERQSEEQFVPLPPQRPQFLGNSSEQRGIPVELFNEDVLLGNSQEPEGGQTLSHGPIYNGMRSDSFSKNWEPSARQGEGAQRPRSFDIIDGNVVFMDEFNNPVRSVPLRRPPGY